MTLPEYNHDLPDDLWNLGIDRAALYGFKDMIWQEHVFAWTNAIYVLNECKQRELSLVLWSIVFWKVVEDGSWDGPGMLWDGSVSVEIGDKQFRRVIDLPWPNVVLISVNKGIEALRGLSKPDDLDASRTRYTLDFHKTDAANWPPNWPKSGYLPR